MLKNGGYCSCWKEHGPVDGAGITQACTVEEDNAPSNKLQGAQSHRLQQHIAKDKHRVMALAIQTLGVAMDHTELAQEAQTGHVGQAHPIHTEVAINLFDVLQNCKVACLK